MSCEGCSSNSTGSDGKPAGCESNGGCSTGGCNKFNVHNWLADYPIADFGTPYDVVEVSFLGGSRKEFFRNKENIALFKGEWVTVEAGNGYDVGQVSVTGELVKLQLKKYGVEDNNELKAITKKSSEEDIKQYENAKAREKDALLTARVIAASLKLDMKITEMDFQADERKVTVFYTANERVDFRELIKLYASEFRAKIEMKQIGARQESAIIGGIGSCGRELCCSTWLVDFKSVNTTAARYQNLSINQTKLSGQCGRLKCCLNYELDTYLDALKGFPKNADIIYLKKGKAYLQKKDIFRNLMWYGFEGSSKQYPLTIERVHEIIALNDKKVHPDELGHVEVATVRQDAKKEVDVGFVNDVGQLSLQALGKSRKKSGKRDNRPGNRQNRPKAQRVASEPNAPRGERQHVKGQQKPKQNAPAAKPARGNTARPTQRPNRKTDGGNRPQQQGRKPRPDNKNLPKENK